MPNANERKIIDRLVHDSGLELKDHELEQMLEAELSKPAEQMDMQLVRELLAVLQPGEVPPAEKQQVWQNVSRAFRSKRKKTSCPLRRLAVIAAIMVLLFGLTIGAASAMRWTFLWKLLQPVAETFGIYRNYSNDETSAIPSEQLYTIEEEEDTEVVFNDLSMLPDTFMGYALKPGWIPEGFEFRRAIAFTNVDLHKYTIDYAHEDDWLNTSVTFYLDHDASLSHLHEKSVNVNEERLIGSKTVSFYRNAKDSVQVVSWVADDNAHYYVGGTLSLEEVEQIVAGFNTAMD